MNEPIRPDWIAPLIEMSDREAATLAFGEAFLEATAQERATVLARWSYDAHWQYSSSRRLACARGERFAPEQRIIANMLLNGIENKQDPRDQLIVCCLYFHSCLYAGLDPQVIFARVAAVLPEAAASLLLGFARRTPENQRLEDFGLQAKPDANGEVEIHIRR